ncbi:MAG: AAA-like domain-containing protein [Fibromonadales bacterium]|nr:AAA-like domain-containing protein [Fibromonadales bacterium]
MPQKYFNIAGPCSPAKHYTLDPLRNFSNEFADLIDSEQYFVIHAARQSGKTTLLKELTRKINIEQQYYALYCSLEVAQSFTDPEKGIPQIVQKIESCIRKQGLPSGFAKDANYSNISNVLNDCLSDYCRELDKPLVVLFDEADCLSNGTLITFLRQLRNGYIDRPEVPFVHSIALVGMRNIRDYKASIRPDSATLGSASPFNIIKESMTLKNFTRDEVAELYSQHTKETEQIFELTAIDYIYEQTQGQPWLVNAIACECVEKICQKKYSIPITQEMAKTAISNIIIARGTHFDSLMERLKEERVRKVIQPLILGEETDRTTDNYLYAKDLGLIRDFNGKVEPSNPIYAEIIIRTITQTAQEAIKNSKPEFNLPKYIVDKKIDMNTLLKDFQIFWRENSEIWKELYDEGFYEYNEAAPHLVMQAFLQRIINGGGHIIREMALGTKRADLCVVYEGQKYPIELKIKSNIKNYPTVFEQLSGYMDKLGSSEGWLVVFDRDTEKNWEDKLYMDEKEYNGKLIHVVGA